MMVIDRQSRRCEFTLDLFYFHLYLIVGVKKWQWWSLFSVVQMQMWRVRVTQRNYIHIYLRTMDGSGLQIVCCCVHDKRNGGIGIFKWGSSKTAAVGPVMGSTGELVSGDSVGSGLSTTGLLESRFSQLNCGVPLIRRCESGWGDHRVSFQFAQE